MSFAMFTATYLLLSIDIGGRPLFAAFYKLTSPATTAAQSMIEDLIGSGVRSSKKVGHKLFENSVPSLPASRSRASTDSFQTIQSAPKPKGLSAPQEHIPETERRELDNLIKSYGSR